MSEGMFTNLFGPQGFVAGDHEPNDSFEVLPPGRYHTLIESVTWKPTKAGSGHYLEFKLQVLDGPCKGRYLWDRLNLDNPSQQAVQIACGQLSAIARAAGIGAITNEAELLNKVVVARVKVRQSKEYGDSNQITGYSDASERPADPGNAPPKQGAPQQAPAPPWTPDASAQPPQPPAATPPWMQDQQQSAGRSPSAGEIPF